MRVCQFRHFGTERLPRGVAGKLSSPLFWQTGERSVKPAARAGNADGERISAAVGFSHALARAPLPKGAEHSPAFILTSMPILDEIVAATRVSLRARKQSADLRQLERAARSHMPRGFRRSLQQRVDTSGVAVIAELKKASPSKGVLRADMNVAEVARDYERGGAAALSVLTEERYFNGSLENLRVASSVTKLPCLRKDFIVDEFQLLEARAHCAD